MPGYDYKTECRLTAGVLRWVSNGSVPPRENVAEALAQGVALDVAACDAARDADLSLFLAEYRANPPQLTAEDLHEARNALGAGATMVNVVTGQRWVL